MKDFFRRLLTRKDFQIFEELEEHLPTDREQLATILFEKRLITSYQLSEILKNYEDQLFVGNYVLQCLVGEGSMARVYMARSQDFDTIYAVKILKPARAASAMVLKRFQREVATLSTLWNDHIVRAIYGGVDGTRHYLVMEYLPGITLEELSRRRGSFSIAEVCSIGIAILKAIQGLRIAGLVHRDIKPSNILISPKGDWVKLVDLGLAHLEPSPETQALTFKNAPWIMGTPDYVSPEQIETPYAVDYRTDIYSLGCTLYYLLVGHAPFDGYNIIQKLSHHLYSEPLQLRSLRKDVPESLDLLICQMLAKQPDLRCSNIEQLLGQLQQFTQEAGETLFACEETLVDELQIGMDRDLESNYCQTILYPQDQNQLSLQPDPECMMSIEFELR
ncbi:MAG: serine/threonine-protein kinase [Zavarzinella sp.]